MSDWLIDIIDQFGRPVRLSGKWWDVHVLRDKPWMHALFHLVELTIASPSLIVHDKEFPDRECFYLIGHQELGKEVMKVVIGYNARQEGFVITAFPRKNVNAGEVQKWPT